MIKPKVWLVQNGHAPKGYENSRGKMPKAYKDLILEAVANGAKIEGYALTASTGPEEAPKVEKAQKTGHEVVALRPYRYTEETHIMREMDTHVERSLREACSFCCLSMVGCYCP